MALEKTINTPYGVTADYHNLQEIHWTKHNIITVSIFSYADHESRIDGKEPLLSSRFDFMDVAEVDLPNVYTLLKTIPLFEGATDV